MNLPSLAACPEYSRQPMMACTMHKCLLRCFKRTAAAIAITKGSGSRVLERHGRAAAVKTASSVEALHFNSLTNLSK